MDRHERGLDQHRLRLHDLCPGDDQPRRPIGGSFDMSSALPPIDRSARNDLAAKKRKNRKKKDQFVLGGQRLSRRARISPLLLRLLRCLAANPLCERAARHPLEFLP